MITNSSRFSCISLRDQLTVSDSGDIDPTLSLEEGHSQLRNRVSSLLKKGKIVFSIGGGNDQSYPNAAGLLDSLLIPPGERTK